MRSVRFSLARWYIILVWHKYAFENGYFMPATRRRSYFIHFARWSSCCFTILWHSIFLILCLCVFRFSVFRLYAFWHSNFFVFGISIFSSLCFLFPFCSFLFFSFLCFITYLTYLTYLICLLAI